MTAHVDDDGAREDQHVVFPVGDVDAVAVAQGEPALGDARDGPPAALEGVFGPERRIELGWMVAGDKLPKGAAKLLLNLALLAGDALVRGGRLDVGAENHDGELELAVRGEGPRIMLDPALRETLLTGGSGERIEPRAAGAWLAHALADEAGGSIRLSDPDSEVLLIGVSLPRQG